MNPPRVSTIEDWPEPTANRVPEAQAPPSCMPMANTNAPSSRPMPSAPADGAGTEPNRPVPVPMISANSVAVVPSSSAWARSPLPFPTAISCRHAEVKPNREWKRAKPSPRPSRSSTPGLAPWAAKTWATSAAASRPEIASGRRRTGGACGAGGGGTRVGDGASAGNRRGFAAGAGGAGVEVVDTGSPEDVRGTGGMRERGRPRERAAERGRPPGGAAGARSAATETVVDAPRRAREQREAQMTGGCRHAAHRRPPPRRAGAPSTSRTPVRTPHGKRREGPAGTSPCPGADAPPERGTGIGGKREGGKAERERKAEERKAGGRKAGGRESANADGAAGSGGEEGPKKRGRKTAGARTYRAAAPEFPSVPRDRAPPPHGVAACRRHPGADGATRACPRPGGGASGRGRRWWSPRPHERVRGLDRPPGCRTRSRRPRRTARPGPVR